MFPPHEARYSSFKLWLKYAKPSRGTLLIDGGAARAVREASASLLPVGVVEVRGEFDAGDAVNIAARPTAASSRASARASATTPRQELRQVQGLNRPLRGRSCLARATRPYTGTTGPGLTSPTL